MAKPKNEIKEVDALAALLKVKPTADMPRPGAQPSKPKARKREVKPKRQESFDHCKSQKLF
jgi:hypothetical protein